MVFLKKQQQQQQKKQDTRRTYKAFFMPRTEKFLLVFSLFIFFLSLPHLMRISQSSYLIYEDIQNNHSQR